MGIDHIAAFFVKGSDRFRRFRFTCIASVKILQFLLHFGCDFIFSRCGKLHHQLFVLLRVASGDQIDQAL